jgi:hypothetical protein
VICGGKVRFGDKGDVDIFSFEKALEIVLMFGKTIGVPGDYGQGRV